jgi:uncharacterized protein (TIRG00374 family)
VFLAPRGLGARRRSATDVVKLVAALLGFAILWFGLSPRVRLQVDLINALHPPALGLSWLVRTLWVVVSAGVVLAIMLAALLGRRLEILRDLAVAGAVAWAVSVGSQHVFGVAARFPSSWFQLVHGVDLGFPVPGLAVSVAVILASFPYLSRWVQRFLDVIIGIGFLCGIMLGLGLPVALLASLIVGWGAAIVVRLAFGSPSGVPGSEQVAGFLEALGVSATQIEPVAHQQWGLARFWARGSRGERLRLSVYGRDARDSQLLSKLYRTVWMRNDVGPFMLTRAQQVDHECYLTLLADQAAPGAAPEVVASGQAGDAKAELVVSKVGAGRSIEEMMGSTTQVADGTLAAMASIVAHLGERRLTHGAIGPDRFFVDGDTVLLVDYDRANSHAPDEGIDRDAAALLITMALASDSKRAAAIGLKALGSDRFVAALPYLQDAAVPPSLTAAIRRQKAKAILKELRSECATAAGVEEPKLVEVKRVSWTNLILIVGTLIGGWALIGVFLHVAQAFSTVRQADVAWVLITAVVAQVAYFGSGAASLGSVTATIPYFPLVILELSNTFSGLALGTPAVLAARVRFFQKHGMDTTTAVSSGVLVSTISWIVKGGLLLISLPFAIGTLKFSSITKSSHSSGGSSLLTWVLIVVVGIGIAVAVTLAVPRLRRLLAQRLVPKLHEVIDHLRTIAKTPRKLAEMFGGMLVAQLVVALALGTALHSVGQHLTLPVIIVVLTLGSVLGGLSPVPGGMGVVEAGMILGLKAAGVPDDQAVAAVFIQRLFTAYLPPVAGWFALMWLRHEDYV